MTDDVVEAIGRRLEAFGLRWCVEVSTGMVHNMPIDSIQLHCRNSYILDSVSLAIEELVQEELVTHYLKNAKVLNSYQKFAEPSVVFFPPENGLFVNKMPRCFWSRQDEIKSMYHEELEIFLVQKPRLHMNKFTDEHCHFLLYPGDGISALHLSRRKVSILDEMLTGVGYGL
jgi:hypothetical protein